MKTVHLQTLEKKTIPDYLRSNENDKISIICRRELRDEKGHLIHDDERAYATFKDKLLYFEESGKRVYYGNMLTAFMFAYNYHRGVILSPDDFMVFVALNFSVYVNANSEKLRPLLVNHKDGKKKLTVVTGDEISELQWDEIFTLMKGEIKKNCKNDVVDILECKFSTTQNIESVISVATIMDTLKSFFDYGRMIPCCGITDLHFTGELKDWEALKYKVSQLKKFAIDDAWKKYVEGLEHIFDHFILAFQDKPDLKFWNGIMNLEDGRLGSGSTTYVTGWFIKLFWKTFYKTKCDVDDLSVPAISVPIEVENNPTRVFKTVELCGEFNGVDEINGSFRPRMRLWIWDHSK
jgi:hypothetical protein